MLTWHSISRFYTFFHSPLFHSRVGQSLTCSQLSASYARGLGLTTQSAASERLNALVTSGVAVQRAGRALIARRRVFRRRQAIAAVQAFFRGCQARWALSMVLEETLRLGLTSRDGDLRRRRDGSGDGGGYCGEDDIDEGEGAPPTTLLSPLQGDGPALNNESLLFGGATTLQVGRLTRHNIPMDAGCPEGFGPPNLSAFLWESQGEAYGCDSGIGAGAEIPLPAPHSGIKARGRCVPTERYTRSRDDDEDGRVFEVSATAVLSSSSYRDEREDRSPAIHETIDTPPQQQPLCVRWVPAAVAPEDTLTRALRCSTLIVNSPSFGSACSRRLFSRIGRPAAAAREQTTISDRSPAKLPDASLATAANNGSPQLPGFAPNRKEAGGEGTVRFRKAHENGAGQRQPARQRLQGDVLRHVLVLGESPIGDGGLAELSSSVRCGWLPRLTTLVIGGPGCRVGPRGVMALAMALSSPGCSRLRNLVRKIVFVTGVTLFFPLSAERHLRYMVEK